MEIFINNRLSIQDAEIEMKATLSQGAGGQNVNKVSTAIHLRFDIKASSLPEFYKTKLLQQKDSRISKDGIIILKAQRFRSLEKNKEDALQRLIEIIHTATIIQKKRKPTKPTKSSKEDRAKQKSKRSQTKETRKKINLD